MTCSHGCESDVSAQKDAGISSSEQQSLAAAACHSEFGQSRLMVVQCGPDRERDPVKTKVALPKKFAPAPRISLHVRGVATDNTTTAAREDRQTSTKATRTRRHGTRASIHTRTHAHTQRTHTPHRRGTCKNTRTHSLPCLRTRQTHSFSHSHRTSVSVLSVKSRRFVTAIGVTRAREGGGLSGSRNAIMLLGVVNTGEAACRFCRETAAGKRLRERGSSTRACGAAVSTEYLAVRVGCNVNMPHSERWRGSLSFCPDTAAQTRLRERQSSIGACGSTVNTA